MSCDNSSSKSDALGYLAVFGIVLVFIIGTVAGRFVTVYPLKRTLKYWDLAASLGTMADDNKDHAIRAAAYLDPDKALADMHSYTWVMRNTPAPFLGTLVAEGSANGVHVTRTGFRAPNDPEMPKPAGRIRVFVVGGSTAFSVGAPNDASTIAGFLETELNESRVASSTIAFEVFTYANPSWASTHERIAIENVLSHFDPDVVVSFSGTNDTVWAQMGRDAHMFRTHYEETWFRVADQAARASGRGPIPDPVLNREGPTPMDDALGKLEENVRIGHFVLQRQGIPYLYALQPTLYAASRLTAREKGLLSKQKADKLEYFKGMYPKIAGRLDGIQLGLDGFTFVDLSDVFKLAEGQEVFLDAYHFGDRGNQLIARALAESLRQSGLTAR